MLKKYRHVIIGLAVSVLTILATVGIASACISGLYQPELPKK